MRTPKAFIMVGLQGSGKSTTAAKIAHLCGISSSEYISADKIREHIGYEPAVWEVHNHLIQSAVSKGYDIVVDNTNIKRKDRKNIIGLIRAYQMSEYEIIAVEIECDLEKCLERNFKRTRVVPKEVIARYALSYTSPSLDEGFDRLVVIDNNIDD